VLIENPFTRELITAVPTEEAEAALLAKGLLKAMPEADIKADKVKAKKDVEADIAALQKLAGTLTQDRYFRLRRAAVIESIMAADEAGAHALLSVGVLRAFVRYSAETPEGHAALDGSPLRQILDLIDTDDLPGREVRQAAALIITNSSGETEHNFAIENKIDTRALTKRSEDEIKAEVAEQIAALKAAQKTHPPKSPLAQPSATPPADEKPKTPKPKAKPKLNAEQAQLGIAEAMQGIEAPPTDGAGAVPPPASQFTKGQQVVVKAVSTQHAVWRQKYEGLTGTVKALNFDSATNLESYGVTFKGRTGGVADFAPDELEAA
jgi:hypothetical protein